MKGTIFLEDGTVYFGESVGSKGISLGEMVFNTSMTGYQEILTDPSYAGQIITFTYPLIGNYGVNKKVSESKKVFARGMIAKTISFTPSNYTSEKSIAEMLNENGIIAVEGVDTRSITKKIRNHGTMKTLITTEDMYKDDAIKIIKGSSEKDDWMKRAGTNKKYNIPGKGPKVAVMDFGIKTNILNNLSKRGCDITVFPYGTSYEEVMSINPEGVLLSNGPGDPKLAEEAVELTRKLLGTLPVFGICLGHQLLGLASGGDTYKMKYGHRGGNHGVKDLQMDKSYITAQNHGYAIYENSLKGTDTKITHINLNDGTVEGLEHTKYPAFSVQFHPEAAPGPQDSEYIFDKFLNMIKGAK